MNNKRRRLLLTQSIGGDGSGGVCPECGSQNTTKCSDRDCNICNDLIETCYCYNCKSSYEVKYCSPHGCDDCSSGYFDTTKDLYCDVCGAETEHTFCGNCGYGICTICETEKVGLG